MGMVYVAEGSFETDFKNKSLPGYYDRIGPSVYVRRDVSMPDDQCVYCYKLNGRWCIGPHIGSTQTWAYSGETDLPPTGQFAWYENIEGKRSIMGRSKTIKIYPTKNG